MWKRLFLTGIIFVISDGLFRYITQKQVERNVIHIQKTSLQIRSFSILFYYLLSIFGLWYFIIKTHRSELDAFLLGIFIYGSIEFTNYTIFKNWPISSVAINTLWGGILFALVTKCAYL